MCCTLKFTFKITVIVGVSSCFVPMDLSYSDDLYLFIPNEVNLYDCFKHFFHNLLVTDQKWVQIVWE